MNERTYKIVITILFVFCLWFVTLEFVGLYNLTRYDRETFNCVDFTKEGVDFFKSIGIKSYQVIGRSKSNHSAGHSWIGIDVNGYILNFEPQIWWLFIPEWEYDNIYVNVNSYYYGLYYRHHNDTRGYYLLTK